MRRKKGYLDTWSLVIIVFGIIALALYQIFSVLLIAAAAIGILAGIVYAMFFIRKSIYYRSEKFTQGKELFKNEIADCNQLRAYIENLRDSHIDIHHVDYGSASYRSAFQPDCGRLDYVYDCSLSVCRSAQQQPFKYICKYFDIDENIQTLSQYETLYCNFWVIDRGTQLLQERHGALMENLCVPSLIQKFDKTKLKEKLGLKPINLTPIDFPTYTFRYISGAGRNTTTCNVELDIDNLERFLRYLSERIYGKPATGEHATIGAKIQKDIKKRDNRQCQCCGSTRETDSMMLLEVRRIIPLSKGGDFSKDNFKTICWRCHSRDGACSPAGSRKSL